MERILEAKRSLLAWEIQRVLSASATPEMKACAGQGANSQQSVRQASPKGGKITLQKEYAKGA
jgi:hypothetical protein